MALDESFDKEKVTEINGIKVILEGPMKDYLANSTLDYRKSFYGEGFYFKDATVSSC